MAEENLNPQEGHARDEFRETVLVRNPTSGQVDAVTHLKNEGNRYAVHTTRRSRKTNPRSSTFAAAMRSRHLLQVSNRRKTTRSTSNS